MFRPAGPFAVKAFNVTMRRLANISPTSTTCTAKASNPYTVVSDNIDAKLTSSPTASNRVTHWPSFAFAIHVLFRRCSSTGSHCRRRNSVCLEIPGGSLIASLNAMSYVLFHHFLHLLIRKSIDIQSTLIPFSGLSNTLPLWHDCTTPARFVRL